MTTGSHMIASKGVNAPDSFRVRSEGMGSRSPSIQLAVIDAATQAFAGKPLIDNLSRAIEMTSTRLSQLPREDLALLPQVIETRMPQTSKLQSQEADQIMNQSVATGKTPGSDRTPT